jgi:hypothetical protein
MLGLLRVAGLSVVLAVPVQGADDGVLDHVVLQLPDRTWGVRVDPPDFEFSPARTVQNGRAVWAAGDSTEPGLMVKIILQDSPGVTDVAGCVARFEQGLDLEAESVSGLKRYRLSGHPVIEYHIRRHRGVEINQRNLHGYLFHDRTCTEMHLSFIGYAGRSRILLERTIRSIHIVDSPGESTDESH